MFSSFYYGLQQDIKIFLIPPVLCALFRLVFILLYGQYPFSAVTGQWKKFYQCFRYGFWWGMDWNTYVLLYSMVILSLPGTFFPAWFELGNTIRTWGLCIYLVVLYAAFIGKLIYYYHYRDIYNKTLWMGKNADKKTLLDIFFRQNHGLLVLLSFVPFGIISFYSVQFCLATPVYPYPAFSSAAAQYAFNTVVVIAAVALFYYFRYGGSLDHVNKPEWDEIPTVVKEDIFLTKATMDDLVALKIVWKHPPHGLLNHTDEEASPRIAVIMPRKDWQEPPHPLELFSRTALGARITPPKHIFFLLAESYEQAPLDPPYANLHIADGGKAFCQDPHTFHVPNFLSAGLISRPSLVSLLLGIYDAGLEFNETEAFWHGTLPTALPVQLHRLGYRSVFWYGGELNSGSLQHFLPAIGFDEMHGGSDFCPLDAPRTWVGVYDHIFLEEAGKKIQAMENEGPAFHFLYTTSNHGPYKVPAASYGYSVDTVMPGAPEAVRHNRAVQRRLGCYWYADRVLFKFVRDMKEKYPDSLFVVTGDHPIRTLPFDCGISHRKRPTLRESTSDFFAISHPELQANLFAGNTIGCHMNILPTLLELIAPKGHEYLSIFPPLTEKLASVVTPHHWLTQTHIGSFDDNICQPIDSDEEDSVASTGNDLRTVRDGWCELSGWIGRHTELLQPEKML